jgi:competence protein ComEA
VTRARASPWLKPAAKAALAVLALVVLSVIGGSAIGGARASTGPSAALLVDAGATPPPVVTLAETVIEAQAPPPPPPAASATAAQGPSRAGAAAGKATPENPVSLNTATFEDLRRLPGVGPKKAEAILALRAKIGKFKRPEDLMRVKGIGRGTFKKLRPLVTVSDGS